MKTYEEFDYSGYINPNDGDSFDNLVPVSAEGSDTEVDFDIVAINNPDLAPGSRVLLGVRGRTGRNVLIGGNPLDIETVNGFGRLATVSLLTGERRDAFLEPGRKAKIFPNNMLYWYENLGGNEPLIIKDTCRDFSQNDEPTLEGVAKVLIGLFSGTKVK